MASFSRIAGALAGSFIFTSCISTEHKLISTEAGEIIARQTIRKLEPAVSYEIDAANSESNNDLTLKITRHEKARKENLVTYVNDEVYEVRQGNDVLSKYRKPSGKHSTRTDIVEDTEVITPENASQVFLKIGAAKNLTGHSLGNGLYTWSAKTVISAYQKIKPTSGAIIVGKVTQSIDLSQMIALITPSEESLRRQIFTSQACFEIVDFLVVQKIDATNYEISFKCLNNLDNPCGYNAGRLPYKKAILTTSGTEFNSSGASEWMAVKRKGQRNVLLQNGFSKSVDILIESKKCSEILNPTSH
jgi:hypothetical protein